MPPRPVILLFRPAVLLLAAVFLLAGCTPAGADGGGGAGSSGDGGRDIPGLADLGDDSLSVLAIYGVDGDELVGDDIDPEYAKVWERFTQLFPVETRPEVEQFVAIDADASGGTDGAMQVNVATGKEYIALDVTGTDKPAELDRTMIHEFGHLLTLRPSQLPVDEDAIATCTVYTTDTGCPTDESYLYAYLTEFWPGVLADDFDDSDDATTARFDDSPDSFVTEYAATNPDEDIAEVFADWVTEDAEPADDSTKARKLRFFDAYPEVVQLREDIRVGLADARP